MSQITAITISGDPSGNRLQEALHERWRGCLMVPFARKNLTPDWEKAFRHTAVLTSPEDLAAIALPWFRAGFYPHDAVRYVQDHHDWTIGEAIGWDDAGWNAGEAILLRKVVAMWKAEDPQAPSAETWRDLGLNPRWTLACAGAGHSPYDAIRLNTGTEAALKAMLQAALANGCDVDDLFLA